MSNNITGIFISKLSESVYNPSTDYILGMTVVPNSTTGFKTIRGILSATLSSSYSITSSQALSINVSSITNQFLNTYNNVRFNNLSASSDSIYIGNNYVFPFHDGTNGQALYTSESSRVLSWKTPESLSPIPFYTMTGTTNTGSIAYMIHDTEPYIDIPLSETWYCDLNLCSTDNDGNTTGTTIYFLVKNDSGTTVIINGIKNNEQLIETGVTGSYKIHAFSSIASASTSSWINITPSGSSLYFSVQNPSESSYTNWKGLMKVYKTLL